MTNIDWKDKLRGCFEDVAVLERCRRETAASFRQFCEFIVEPAFEALEEEFKAYQIRAKHEILNGKSISLVVDFRKSKTDQFRYTILLPKNSIELRLKVQVRGRRAPNASVEDKVEPFMSETPPDKVMKIAREDLIADVIAKYRDFLIESMSRAD